MIVALMELALAGAAAAAVWAVLAAAPHFLDPADDPADANPSA